MLSRRLLGQDLAWAGIILLLAAVLGIWQQWQLVRLSWTGALPAHLEQQRQQRRQVEFQGVKTLNLPQTYEIFQGGQALFVDARDADEYAELHIAGAVNLPRTSWSARGTGPWRASPGTAASWSTAAWPTAIRAWRWRRSCNP